MARNLKILSIIVKKYCLKAISFHGTLVPSRFNYFILETSVPVLEANFLGLSLIFMISWHFHSPLVQRNCLNDSNFSSNSWNVILPILVKAFTSKEHNNKSTDNLVLSSDFVLRFRLPVTATTTCLGRNY